MPVTSFFNLLFSKDKNIKQPEGTSEIMTTFVILPCICRIFRDWEYGRDSIGATLIAGFF